MWGSEEPLPGIVMAAQEKISLRKERPNARASVLLLPFLFTLHNCDIPVDRKIAEALRSAPGLRPLNLQEVNAHPFPQSQNHARILRGQVTPAADFHPA